MSSSRFQFEYRQNASALHKKVGNLIRDGGTFVGQQEVYQEYPVNRVNSDYPDSSHHFDWVVPNLKVVIECHGKQHYVATAFDGDYEAALVSFEELKGRDKAKKEAALEAGFTYIEVPYSSTSKLNELWFAEAYGRGQTELAQYNRDHEEARQKVVKEKERVLAVEMVKWKKEKAKELREEYRNSAQHQRELRLAREFRKKRYKKLKELKEK